MTRHTRRTSARRRRRDERGSVAIEAAIGVPAFGLFVVMIILGGRVESAKQSVDAAAYEAARAASIERTQSEAITSGKSAATSSLHDQGLQCTTTNITINAAAFNAPLGTTAHVTATTWREVGEFVAEGQPPVQNFEMNLTKVGDTDWPLGTPVTPTYPQ